MKSPCPVLGQTSVVLFCAKGSGLWTWHLSGILCLALKPWQPASAGAGNLDMGGKDSQIWSKQINYNPIQLLLQIAEGASLIPSPDHHHHPSSLAS